SAGHVERSSGRHLILVTEHWSRLDGVFESLSGWNCAVVPCRSKRLLERTQLRVPDDTLGQHTRVAPTARRCPVYCRRRVTSVLDVLAVSTVLQSLSNVLCR